MSSGDVSRQTIRRIIDEHKEAGTVPLQVLVDLIKAPEPPKRSSASGLYIVRHYDGFDHNWIDVSKEMSWEEAVVVWNDKTQGGMQNTCYGDIDYYDIFPAGTRMIYSEG